MQSSLLVEPGKLSRKDVCLQHLQIGIS